MSVAALKRASPACEARNVQVPVLINDTVAPLTVHVEVVRLVKVMPKPEDDVADAVKVELYLRVAESPGFANVIVWLALVMVND